MVFCGLDFIHDLGLFVLMFLMGSGEQVSVLGRYGGSPQGGAVMCQEELWLGADGRGPTARSSAFSSSCILSPC